MHNSKTINQPGYFAFFRKTEFHRDELHDIGCDFYQGYFYSPAVVLEEKQ